MTTALPRSISFVTIALTTACFYGALPEADIGASALYLDFETDLHDLCARDSEIRGRKIGVEVHRGE